MAMKIRSKQDAARATSALSTKRKTRTNLVGGGIDGTRTVITEKTPLMEFVVSEKAAIADNLGNKCYPGQTAYLDEPTAKFMAERGYIKVEIRFDTGDAKSAAAVRAKAKSDVPVSDEEAEDGASVDTGGEQSTGGSGALPDDEAEGDGDRRPRRKRTRSTDA